MTREEKIAAIYKEMANKELTRGCYVRIEPPYNEYGTFLYRLRGDESKEGIKEIIGHPVMIGDVVDYTGEKKIDIVWSDSSCVIDIRDGENSLNLFNLWGNKRTPIEDQSDECIDYVYSLIQED